MKREFGKPRCRYDVDIKMDLERCEGLEWI
jgi:hypothetical protein